MRGNWLISTIWGVSAVMMSAIGGVQESFAQGCSGASGECVEVEFPGAKERPKVDKDILRINKKDSSGDKNKFSFGTQSSAGDNALIIFKCQNESVQPHDCRTPAVSPSGDEVWVLKLTTGGVAAARVNDTLELCDACEEKSNAVDYEECVMKYCRYPYMVVDKKGERPPLDPDVIVDPR